MVEQVLNENDLPRNVCLDRADGRILASGYTCEGFHARFSLVDVQSNRVVCESDFLLDDEGELVECDSIASTRISSTGEKVFVLSDFFLCMEQGAKSVRRIARPPVEHALSENFVLRHVSTCSAGLPFLAVNWVNWSDAADTGWLCIQSRSKWTNISTYKYRASHFSGLLSLSRPGVPCFVLYEAHRYIVWREGRMAQLGRANWDPVHCIAHAGPWPYSILQWNSGGLLAAIPAGRRDLSLVELCAENVDGIWLERTHKIGTDESSARLVSTELTPVDCLLLPKSDRFVLAMQTRDGHCQVYICYLETPVTTPLLKIERALPSMRSDRIQIVLQQ
jgi:hypothetical protein